MSANVNRRGLAAAFLASCMLLAAPALAHDTQSTDGTIKITGPWTRATPNGATTAGGFLSITNTGKQADRLIGGSFEDSNKVEIHEMAMADGVMKMHELAGGLVVKPGETVTLKPSGFHVMFIGLKAPIKDGDGIWGTLVFEHAGVVRVHFHAQPMGAKEPMGHGDHKMP